MSKWKCDICGTEFDNFQAQGFDNKIYCPLCFYKHEFNTLNKGIDDLIEKYNKRFEPKGFYLDFEPKGFYLDVENTMICEFIKDLKNLKGE